LRKPAKHFRDAKTFSQRIAKEEFKNVKTGVFAIKFF